MRLKESSSRLDSSSVAALARCGQHLKMFGQIRMQRDESFAQDHRARAQRSESSDTEVAFITEVAAF